MENREIELEIAKINERNKRVEADKAWETSFTRRLILSFGIYILALVLLISIGSQDPVVSALLPMFGFIISTLSIPHIKAFWLKSYKK